MPNATEIKLEIINITGQKVGTILEGFYEGGHHTATWNGDNHPSGVYLYRLTAGSMAQTKKMVLSK